MVKPIADLTSFSENACFLNYNFLHRSADYSWLKLYVLLYDFLVFDSRNTLAMPLDWNLEAWEWLKKNSLYLEDFTEYKTHIELKEFGNQLLKQFAFRKSKISDPMEWVYNKNFLSTFFKKMRRRGDGESNQSDWFEYLPLNP